MKKKQKIVSVNVSQCNYNKQILALNKELENGWHVVNCTTLGNLVLYTIQYE